MYDIMLDIETMGTNNNAAIVSIGAVRIDSRTWEIKDNFYRVVSLKSSWRAGGLMDADTVIWWLTQDEEARKALTGDDSVLIDSALKEFAEWVRKFSLNGIWGNGASFDNVILENAYLRSFKTPPWTYTMNRCYRTLKAIYPEIARIKSTVPHHALFDAIAQAEHLCEIMKRKDT